MSEQTQENKTPARQAGAKHWKKISPDLLMKVAQRAAECKIEGLSSDAIVQDVLQVFGVEIGSRTLRWKLSNDWKPMIHAVRQKAETDVVEQCWISSKALRVKRYQRLAQKAEEDGKCGEAAKIMFLAAKELGQITDRHEHSGRFEVASPEVYFGQEQAGDLPELPVRVN